MISLKPKENVDESFVTIVERILSGTLRLYRYGWTGLSSLLRAGSDGAESEIPCLGKSSMLYFTAEFSGLRVLVSVFEATNAFLVVIREMTTTATTRATTVKVEFHTPHKTMDLLDPPNRHAPYSIWKDHNLTRRFANRLIYLQLRTRLGKEKRPPEPIPATFVLSGSPQWTIFATFS